MRDKYLKEVTAKEKIESPATKETGPLFGELAEKWYVIKSAQVKASSMRDYQSAMHLYVLPRFSKRPIKDISYFNIEEFKAGLKCSSKRINNILVPMRSVFTMAYKEGIIRDNVMRRVDNLRVDEPTINPFTLEEALKVIESVHPHYRNCLTMSFFTGVRFGEMAALKWRNVDLCRKTARICETLVYGVEGPPKTKKSNRDIDLLPPVMEALEVQKRVTCGKSEYVFLDLSGKPLNPDHVRNVIWKRALQKAGITYRPPMQTRHTVATLMLSEGENIGWVQNMLGHGSLKIIFTKYYAWIPKKTRTDGSAFMKTFKSVQGEQVENNVRIESQKMVYMDRILQKNNI